MPRPVGLNAEINVDCTAEMTVVLTTTSVEAHPLKVWFLLGVGISLSLEAVPSLLLSEK